MSPQASFRNFIKQSLRKNPHQIKFQYYKHEIGILRSTLDITASTQTMFDPEVFLKLGKKIDKLNPSIKVSS